MADKKVSDMTQLTSGVSTDLLYVVNTGAGAAGSKYMTLADFFNLSAGSGLTITLGAGTSIGLGTESPSAQLHTMGNTILGGGVTACGGTSVIVISSGVTPTSFPAKSDGATDSGGVTGGVLWVNDSGALMYRGALGTDTLIANA